MIFTVSGLSKEVDVINRFSRKYTVWKFDVFEEPQYEL